MVYSIREMAEKFSKLHKWNTPLYGGALVSAVLLSATVHTLLDEYTDYAWVAALFAGSVGLPAGYIGMCMVQITWIMLSGRK
jgi:hypothetical protein